MSQTFIKYVKIIALNTNELPIETIEGYATGGSINIDGKSAVRRSCQLNLISNSKFTEDYWFEKNKFQLYIGIKENEEIAWKNMGRYVISQFSYSINSNSSTINISGKDKMCLLNGEVAGHFGAPIRLDEEDVDGEKKKVLIPVLIREMVHSYGHEQFHNIIINDLDISALELQEYAYRDKDLYLERKANSSTYDQAYLGKPENAPDEESKYDNLFNISIGVSNELHYAKVQAGETAGYYEIPLTYPDELTAAATEAVTGVLDKIKNMLGDFEYFYDVDGRFIFQQKKTYVNSSWNPIQKETEYIAPYVESSAHVYDFTNSPLFISFNKTPDINGIKNDFTIIGSNEKNPNIVLRYSLHRKPKYYKSISVSEDELENYNVKYGFKILPQGGQIYSSDDYDWREIIYQMARDYSRFSHLDSFASKIIEANGNLYPGGITGYEYYYTDLLSFWRELYDPELEEEKRPKGWNSKEAWTDLALNPAAQRYWLEFLECDNTVLEKYSIPVFGLRSKVQSDNNIKAIAYKETPNIIFVENQNDEINHTGYAKIQIGPYSQLFTKSAQGKTAKTTLDTLLYNHTFCSESISAQLVPVYELEPNTLIHIEDARAKVYGDYIINSLSIPLTYNGNMSINLIKKIERLY